MLGLLAKVKRVHRLLIVRKRLRHRANDGSLGVAAERRLQNASHLAVTIVDKGLAIPLRELVDDVRQREETPIDITALSEA